MKMSEGTFLMGAALRTAVLAGLATMRNTDRSRFLPLFVVLALLGFAGRAGAAAPTLTFIADLPGGNEDQVTSITYATLLAASDAADADGDPIEFRLKSPMSGVLREGPSVVPINGTLSPGETWTWTPQADANGVIGAFGVRAYAAGQESASNVTVPIDVPPVNDAPSFTKGGSATVDEDSAPYSESNWATNIDPGAPNESGQTAGLAFVITSNNRTNLFSTQPAVSPDGTLTFTLAQDQNGLATINVILTDQGGVERGGVDQSPEQTFTIDVTPVNDPPSFTKGPDQAVPEQSVPPLHTVAGWATSISPGPLNESTQTVAFVVTNDFPDMFQEQPQVEPNGTLSYRLTPNTPGVATVGVRAQDDGGVPGIDTSAVQHFQIEVYPLDRFEPNDTLEEATVLGSEPSITERDLSIGIGSDQDWFRITANQTGGLIINALFSDADSDVDIVVTDASTNFIAGSYSTTDNEQVTIPVVGQQAYFLHVYSFDNEPASYDLEIENFAAPVPNAVVLDTVDDTGISNTDNITSEDEARIFIDADLSGFANIGIAILDPADVASDNPGAAVEVVVNGVAVGIATPVPGTGNTLFEFTFAPGDLSTTLIPVAGGGGLNLVTAGVRVHDPQLPQADDRAPLSDPLLLTLDMSAPSPVTRFIAPSSDTGIYSSDSVTRLSSPVITGRGEALARLRCYADDGTSGPIEIGVGAIGSDESDVGVGGAPDDGLGIWEITTAPLNDQVYNVSLEVEDAAGNVTPVPPIQVEIDTKPPALPLLDLFLADDTGIQPDDEITSINTPLLSASSEDPTANPLAFVHMTPLNLAYRVYSRLGSGPEVLILDSFILLAGFTDSLLVWSTTDALFGASILGPLADGTHSLRVEVEDRAGNISDSFLLDLVIDTSIAAGSAPDLTAASDSGEADDDDITGIIEPTFAGTGAEAGASVSLMASNTTSGTVQQVGNGTADSGGGWTITSAALDDGVYDVFVTVTDVAGNTADSATLTVEIDSTLPLEPTLRLIKNYATCVCNGNVIIGQPNLDFEVIAEVDHIVEIIDNATVADSFVSTGLQARTVLFETGHHAVSARVRDTAGQVTIQTDPIDFFVDVTPPDLTCPIDMVVECGDSTDTNDTGVATATDICTNDIVIAWSDALAAGSCGGEYFIYRTWTATDACGNMTNCMQTISVVDTTPPLLICPDDVVLLGDTGCVAVLPDLTGDATTFDACSSVSLTQDPMPGTNLPGPSDYAVTLYATDGCHTSQCTFMVTVRCRTIHDYDGDGVSDIATFNEASGTWDIYSVALGAPILQNGNWGAPGMIAVPGDYDGDGVADLAVYRVSTGEWFIYSLATDTMLAYELVWGYVGATPMSGDFNGDGIDDLAVYDDTIGDWFILTFPAGDIIAYEQNWGYAGFRPVPGDYNGDGINDLAVYEQLTGDWYIMEFPSLDVMLYGFNWGFVTYTPVAGDYDGDGISDLTVFEGLSQNWWSWSTPATPGDPAILWYAPWGFLGCVAVPGDYDGDGIYDRAVYYEPSGHWWILGSNGTILLGEFLWGGLGFEAVRPAQ